MMSDRPCFSRNTFSYIHPQRNCYLQVPSANQIFYQITLVKNMIKVKSVHIVTTACQHLKTKAVHNLKEQKRAQSYLRIVNYLEVRLNLNDGSSKPYDKPDDITQYINK